MHKLDISEALAMDGSFIVDTRTPKEYELDHIPGSVNIPIFENEERHIIGILYKKDKEKAFDLGFKLYNEKLPKLMAEIETIPNDKKIIVYCWRGGMRSKTVAELISRMGYDSYQLIGGYKSYREHVRIYLENWKAQFRLIILHGFAGCGKTDIIRRISPSIDLEGYAGHRSSLFGDIGLVPNEQKRFDTLLWNRLEELKNEKFVFIEGESHKVGRVFIPVNVFKAMKEGIGILVNRDIKLRSRQIVKDYFTHGEDARIKEIIWSLRSELTKDKAVTLMAWVDERRYLEVAEKLLTDYYDPKYLNHIKEKGARCIFEVNSDDEDACIKELLSITERIQNTTNP